MTIKELFTHIQEKKTMLCVGLDSDVSKIPASCSLLDFNKAIIDATAEYSVAFKPNLAFYEAAGIEGLRVLEKSIDYIRSNYPKHFLIADAKRGDIGNTAEMYAKTFFETMDFDAVTLSPYMGLDTVLPFLKYKGKFAIMVALSSNKSAVDFQYYQDGQVPAASEEALKPLYRRVIEKMMSVSSPENMMFVVGATKADQLSYIRTFCPENFFLVPGVGAQGGSASEVIKAAATDMGGLLINSSRAILYASSEKDFAEAAARVAEKTAKECYFK